MKKRILMLITAGSLLLASCGNAATGTTGSADAASSAAETVESTTEEADSSADNAESEADKSDSSAAEAAETADAADSSASETTESAETTGEADGTIPYWTEDSEVMKSIVSFVNDVTDESADTFVPVEDRIAVFDFDGTLFGELYPTYFDECLMLHRVLHDDTYEAPADVKEYAQASEEAYQKGLPQPETSLSSSAISADAFKGMTVEEYRDYVREFMGETAFGFENMTYGEGFYLPMVAVVQYLAEHDFTVFISSGSERAMVRELTEDTLSKWVPSYRIIGSTFSLEATGQGDTDGRKYTLTPDDKVVMSGSVVIKNQQANKVYSILNEIGKAPTLVFGNSTGDLAMGEYALQNGGKGYMLLCDDTERDYGNLETAEKFAKKCDEMGFETVSMKNDFATIYKEDAVKVPVVADESTAEAAESAVESKADATAESAAESTAEAAESAAESTEALAPAA